MSTDYATAPVTGKVYGNAGIEELMADAWMGVDHELPPDLAAKPSWDDARRLTMGPSTVFLAFEQGCNAPPMVFALKSDPSWDLARDSGFGLHYLADSQDGGYPRALLDFYRPVADLIARLAGESHRSIRDRGIEVMTLLFTLLAEQGIVRAQEHDEDSGELIGLDRDIAADLPAAWATRVTEETA
ncbi:hypothetical protein AB0F72_08575 [Actinoplanes sp. NPDC023936]|uniref:hypothetical protein n=1 Tax=Actinoplanes sp. NPDC023936 TaxID=3154910 RepID=UPI00340483E2